MVKYPRRFQFKLRTLFLAMFYIGIALAVGRTTKEWWHGLSAVVAVAAVIGLIQQINELLRFSGAQRSSAAPDRGAVGLAIGWRAALVVFLEFAFLCSHFPDLLKLTPIGFSHSRFERPSSVNFALYLFLLVALNTKPITLRAPTRWTRIIGFLSLLACSFWLWLIWMDWGLLTYLVHAAIEGIVLSQKPKVMTEHFLGAATRPEYDANQRMLIIVTTIALVELVLAVVLVWILARRGSRLPRWLGDTLIASVLLAFVAIAATVYWIEAYGVPRVSPFIAANRLELSEPYHYVFPAMIVLTGVTALTYRFIGTRENEGPVWTSRSAFAHEHWIISFVALVLFSRPIIEFFWEDNFFGGLILASMFYDPDNMMIFALLATSIRNLYRAFAHRRIPPLERRVLQTSKWFYFIWVCLLLCALATGPVVLWSSFAYWTDARIPPEFMMPNE